MLPTKTRYSQIYIYIYIYIVYLKVIFSSLNLCWVPGLYVYLTTYWTVSLGCPKQDFFFLIDLAPVSSVPPPK